MVDLGVRISKTKVSCVRGCANLIMMGKSLFIIISLSYHLTMFQQYYSAFIFQEKRYIKNKLLLLYYHTIGLHLLCLETYDINTFSPFSPLLVVTDKLVM